MATLPIEKVNQIRQLIHDQMTQLNINSVISGAIDELVQEGNQFDEKQLLEALRRRGVIDKIVESLKFRDYPQTNHQITDDNPTLQPTDLTKATTGNGNIAM